MNNFHRKKISSKNTPKFPII